MKSNLPFMCHLWVALAFHIVTTSFVSAQDKTEVHRVMSCNIRVDHLPEDLESGNDWNSRKDFCIEVIRAQQADLICAQEVLRSQMQDLKKALPEYGSYGFEGPEMDARKEGYQGIAKNPIFYLRARYEFISAGSFWLSETPHLPGSLSWEALRARHVNWLRLRDLHSGKEFRIINTHLDHGGEGPRGEQIKLVLAEAATYASDFPQILAGDFNARSTSNVYRLITESGWTDSREAAPGPKDHGSTVHSFLGSKHSKPGLKPIDFVFTSGPVTSLAYKTLRDSRNDRYPSDHYFILTELSL